MTVGDNNKKRAREEAKKKADQYISKDGGPPEPKADVREELAGLERIEYGQRREDLAAALGVPKALLDEEYKEQRKVAAQAAATAAAAERSPSLARRTRSPGRRKSTATPCSTRSSSPSTSTLSHRTALPR